MDSENKIQDEVYECHAEACRGKIITLLLDVGRIISEQNDLDTALDKLLGYMQQDMGIRRAMISLFHQESGKIYTHRSIGLTQTEQERGVYLLGEGVTGKAVESALPIIIPHIGEEPSFLNRTGSLVQKSDHHFAFLCIPITRGSKVLGTISAERPYPNGQALAKHAEVLGVMANLLSQAVELYLIENFGKVRLGERVAILVGELKERYQVSSSKPMQQVYNLISKVSPSKATVLLLGESGVGKEMFASALHYGGPTPTGPYIKFNCAALPESLIESELFGHEKGAFTGALFRKGRFEEANGGTIFLDEIGELSAGMQAKLLRVLQERCFERVGGNQCISLDIRIIVATNRNLEEMVHLGTFREDLLYRLNGFPIMIPPLRERRGDIVPLAEHFLRIFAKSSHKEVKGFSTSVLNALTHYTWPGNVRELENAIHRAVILAEDEIVHAHDLPLATQDSTYLNTRQPNGLEARLTTIEYEMIVDALKKYEGNITEAAKALCLTRRTMGIRMKRFNLTFKQFRKKWEN